MRISTFLLLTAGISQQFCACNNLGEIDQLSPLEVDSLKSTVTKGLYQVSSRVMSPPPEVDSTATPALKTCTENELYRISILYPVTICTVSDFPDELLYTSFPGRPRDSIRSWFGRTDKRFTATREASFRGFTNPLYCRTHNGPWIAEVKKEGSCTQMGAPKWEMTIVGIPETISWVWFGEWDNGPDVQYIAEPQLQASSRVDCDPSNPNPCAADTVTGHFDGGKPVSR